MKRLRFSLRALLAVMACVAGIVACASGYYRSRTAFSVGGRPGDVVYMDGDLLGDAPVYVSQAKLDSLGLSWQPDVPEGRAVPSARCGVVYLKVQRADGTSPLIWWQSKQRNGVIQCETPWGISTAAGANCVGNGRHIAPVFQSPRLDGGGVGSEGGCSFDITRAGSELQFEIVVPMSHDDVIDLIHAGIELHLHFQSVSSEQWVNVSMPLCEAMTEPIDSGGMKLRGTVSKPAKSGTYYAKRVTLEAIGKVGKPVKSGAYYATADLRDRRGYSLKGLPSVIVAKRFIDFER